ncbi:Gamma-glutamyltranspeptidase 2 [Folsomia candida]|uniref:Gamma-glutamyltranspeptidase 2 n=1 Tax=Folsomia candida TaxID=158441 RepID=A0A226DC21_FOLCA|nr:Gamma-glutamyltranspeptidase 2 [Folsomia candida]
MPTPLIFYGIDYSFRLNSYLWKTPIGWDRKRDRMTYDNSPPVKYFWWYFLVYVVFNGVGGASCVYTIYWQYYSPRKELNISHSIQYALQISAGGLAAGITLVVMIFGQHAVQVVNGVLDFHDLMKIYEITEEKIQVVNEKLNKRLAVVDRLFRRARIPSIFLPDGGLDWAGMILLAGLTVLHVVVLVIVPTTVLILRIDVYRWPLEDMWSYLNVDYETNPVVFLPEKQMATQTFFMMTSGLFFCAALNFATIRFLDFGMPPLYYAIWPFFAILLILMILSLLPVAINVYENSANILTIWGHSIPGGRKENAWLRKKLRSIRAPRVYSGFVGFYFYKLDASVLTTYFMSIQDWTINFLMTFHPSAEEINALTYGWQ